MDVILIGGLYDGKHLSVPDDSNRITLPGAASFVFSSELYNYHIFPFHPKPQTIIFALDGMTPEEILERLITGYVHY